MSDSLSLDDLFDEVKGNIPPARHRKDRAESAHLNRIEQSFLDTYQKPENWKESRHVALIHAPTQTLLGNFTELLHIRLPGVRRLVRADGPCLVSCVEEVTDAWWIEEHSPDQKVPSVRADRFTRAIIDAALPDLKVSAAEVEVTVHLHWGGILKVTLAEDVRFAGEGACLDLPRGTDILKGLSFEAKVALRKEIGV